VETGLRIHLLNKESKITFLQYNLTKRKDNDMTIEAIAGLSIMASLIAVGMFTAYRLSR
jgi:hypothetical protein